MKGKKCTRCAAKLPHDCFSSDHSACKMCSNDLAMRKNDASRRGADRLGQAWTHAEDQFLRDHLGMLDSEIAQKLKRTTVAVTRRRNYHLGITKALRPRVPGDFRSFGIVRNNAIMRISVCESKPGYSLKLMVFCPEAATDKMIEAEFKSKGFSQDVFLAWLLERGEE